MTKVIPHSSPAAYQTRNGTISRGVILPRLIPVSRQYHTGKFWQRVTDYHFAARDTVCPLALLELPRAMLCLPIAFIADCEEFALVAVQGLGQGKNLLVAPNGSWVGAYIPVRYRSYPFRIAKGNEGQQVLCIDEESGLINDDASGESIFDAEGEPSAALTKLMQFLAQYSASLQMTASICSHLQKFKLLQPWPIKRPDGETTRTVDGLCRIDEAALNKLSAKNLAALRDVGGLTVAYSQLLSMQHIAPLTELLDAHTTAAAQAMPQDLNLDFLNDDGIISFGNL
ncbi:MAG: SapC family protein [Pseudomonadales bacterium]|nr:SapC family protein [Pseudomonadales bacterium]